MPRLHIEGTEVEGHLSPEWHEKYKQNLRDEILPEDYKLKDVLRGETLRRATRALPPEVMDSPVSFLESLPDATAGTIVLNPESPSGWNIVLNARTWFDPSDMPFLLTEEAMHIARRLKKRRFDFSKPCEDQVHERTAKKGALYVVGRKPGKYHMPVIR